MARKKLIEDQILIELIQKFYVEKCNQNPKRLKLPAIIAYINQNGYPDYRVESLRRTPAARDYIDSLNNSIEEKSKIVVASYKTLDIDAFLSSNKTTVSLKKALAELDIYYRNVASSASDINNRYKTLEKKYQSVSEELFTLREQTEQNEETIASLKENVKALTESNKVLRDIVTTYVYPDIANELLAKAGDLVREQTTVDPDKLESNLIHADTAIKKTKAKSGSSVIQGMFDNFEE